MARKIFFEAYDKAGKPDLWVTDGKTTEAVGGISDIGVAGSGQGLGPSDFAIFGDQMIFNGTDSLAGANGNGLWLTDGTAGGTTEIGGVSPGSPNASPFPNGDPNGLSPNTFTVFGDKSLFLGTDTTGFTYLWVTDGTKAGTTEIGGLQNGGIANAATVFSVSNFAAFGNHALFDGYDSTGYQGLWITDGTAAGTTPLGGIVQAKGVADSGLSNFYANDFITLGAHELFNAPNATGDAALWITDGTGVGTTEIGGAGNVGVVGAATGLGAGLAVSVVFGNRVFFAGGDKNGSTGLWATDGTAAGTTEIGGLDDAGVVSHGALGLNPTNFAVMGQTLLFNGVDKISFNELWATDGTALGAVEIGGVGDILLSHVAANGLNPEEITPLGDGRAVFVGFDDSNNQAQGKASLWVTDGTTAGTQEIGGLQNQGVANVYANGGLTPSGLVGGDGVAFFTGEDALGNYVLWETDGTVGGTKVVQATDGSADTTGIVPANMTQGPPSKPPSAADQLPQDLTKVAYKSTLEAVYDPVSGAVKILDTGNNLALVASIALSGAALAGALIKLANDGAGHTQVTLTTIPNLSGGDDKVVSGIKGKPYIGYRRHFVGSVLMETEYFYAATGQPYQYYERDVTGGNVLFMQRRFTSGVAGKPYRAYEKDYDGGLHLMRVAFSDVNAAYSAYELDYNVGVFTGEKFTFTNTPVGATFSSYETDYDAAHKRVATKYFTTGVKGKAYTGVEVDRDGAGVLTHQIYTGVKGFAYSSYEKDFTGGVYTGVKYFYDHVVGKTFGAEEIDRTATGDLRRVVYDGMTGVPYTSKALDYTGSGAAVALAGVTYTYANIVGKSYYQYAVSFDGSSAKLQTTYWNKDGSHTIVGGPGGYHTIDSIGDDAFTGSAFGVQFNLHQGFGHAEITDFYNHTSVAHPSNSDTVVFSKLDFASFAALSGAVAVSGANLVVTATNGDRLTLDNMTKALLVADQSLFSFV